MTKTIIGLTGSMGCGKGEIVKILEKEGFSYITLSMMVREEARARGVEEKREKLMEVGNSMRADGGAGILAVRALSKIADSDCDKWVVDGIRNPAEISALRAEKDAKIVGIYAGKDLLVDRIVGRARESDAVDREGILRKIEREWGEGEPEDGQQVGKCMKIADIVVENEGTLLELQEKFISYYHSIKG